MPINYGLVQQKVQESRKKGVREDIIQQRVNEIEQGIDADEYYTPDQTPSPTMAGGQPAVRQPVVQSPPEIQPDYKSLRMSQAADIQADLANGGKNVDKITKYYDTYQPSQAELDAIKRSQQLADDEKKIAVKKDAGDKAVKGLLQTLHQLKADSANVGIADVVGGVLGVSSKNKQFENKRALAAQFLAKAIENGRLSDKDREFYKTIISVSPIGLQTPKNEELDNLIDTISGLTEVKRTQPRSQGSVGMEITDAVKNTGNAMFGTAKNVVQDITQGTVANRNQPIIENAEKQAEELERLAYAQTDIQKRKQYLQQANVLRSQISSQAQTTAQNFSEDVNQNPLVRAPIAAAQIAGGADLLANPALAIKAPAAAVRHPIQTAKAVVQTVKHPVQTAKAVLANDYASSFGGSLPGAASAKAYAGGAPAPIAPAQDPAQMNPAVVVRDKMAKDFSTSIAVTNPESVVKSEEAIKKAYRMTTSQDPRGVARELELNLPKYREATVAYAKQRDQQVGLQPLTSNQNDGVLDVIMDRLANTSAAQANPHLLETMRGILTKQLNVGDLGEVGLGNGVTAGTNFEKLNESRMYMNKSLNRWFAAGQPEGNPTNDLNALKWEASKAMKDIMSDGDDAGVFRELLDKQHTALEVIPALSKEVLKNEKVSGIGTGVRRVYEAVRDRTILRNAPRGDTAIPQLSMADGTPATGTNNGTPPIQNTSGQPYEAVAPDSPTTMRGETDPAHKIIIPKPEPGSDLKALTSPEGKIDAKIIKWQKVIDDIKVNGSDETGRMSEKDIPNLQEMIKNFQKEKAALGSKKK